jgi:hypothetical protein
MTANVNPEAIAEARAEFCQAVRTCAYEIRKPKKEEALQKLEEVMEGVAKAHFLPLAEAELPTAHDLAVLYAHFLPPKGKTAKTPDGFVRLATAQQNSQAAQARPDLVQVAMNSGVIFAADGPRLHWTKTASQRNDKLGYCHEQCFKWIQQPPLSSWTKADFQLVSRKRSPVQQKNSDLLLEYRWTSNYDSDQLFFDPAYIEPLLELADLKVAAWEAGTSQALIAKGTLKGQEVFAIVMPQKKD